MLVRRASEGPGFWSLGLALAGCAVQTPDLSAKGGSPPPTTSVSYVERDAASETGGVDSSVADGDGLHGSPSSPPGSTSFPEPTGDRALQLMHAVIDSRFVYFCRAELRSGELVAGTKPFPEDGLGFGDSVNVTLADAEIASGVAWSLVAASDRIDEDTDCEQLARQARSGAPVALPVEATDGGVESDATAADSGAGLGATPDGSTQALVTDAAVSGPALQDASASSDATSFQPADASVDPAGAPLEGGLSAVAIPPLRVLPFAALLEGALDEELSTLLVAAGCVGGYAEAPEEVCGQDYSRRQSTLVPIYTRLSRLNEIRSVGLQVVNASVLTDVSVRSEPGEGIEGSFFTVATRVSRGQIQPPQLRNGIGLASIGEPLAQVHLRVEQGNDLEPLYRSDWQQVLDQANVQLREGRGFTFVVIGSPGGDDVQFRSLGLRLLSNDPGRDRRELAQRPDAGDE